MTGLKACYEDQAYLANLTKLKQDIRAEVGRVTNVFFEKQRLDTSISDTSVADEKTALYYSYTKDRQSSPLSQSLFLIIAHTFGDARIPIDRRPASGIFLANCGFAKRERLKERDKQLRMVRCRTM